MLILCSVGNNRTCTRDRDHVMEFHILYLYYRDYSVQIF
jgi:hypothetical protein